MGPKLPNTSFKISDSTIQVSNSYTYQVTAINSAGSSTPGISATVTPQPFLVAPGAPTSVTATAGENTATVSWKAPTSGGTVASYKVEKSINGGAFKVVNAKLANTIFKFIDIKAINGQKIMYRVTAINSAGIGLGVDSNQVTPQRIAGVPAAPSNVNAVVSTAGITISWVAPGSIDVPTYYVVEKSTDNQVTFSTVDSNVPATKTSILDPNVLSNTSHIYRVFSGNAVGVSSVSTMSNAVTPVPPITKLTPALVLESNNPAADNNFGEALAISPDGKTLAVGEKSGGTVTDGRVHLFSKSSNSWIHVQELSLKPPVTSANQFGHSLAFSPDGNTLAVGDINGGPGTTTLSTVQIFNKSVSGWTQVKALTAKANTNANQFGFSLAFSPDGNTLAVGELSGDPAGFSSAGTVQLFKTIDWTNFQVIISPVPAVTKLFGISVAFSPDGSTLAVGELYADVGVVASAGSVRIFTKPNSTWGYTSTLTPKAPKASSYFGRQLAFSSDNDTLAVGELYGDPGGVSLAGTVQLFQKSIGWARTDYLTAKTPSGNSRFGASLSFSPDGNKLAVGLTLGGTSRRGKVQLLNKSVNGWDYAQVLIPSIASGNNFGYSIVYDLNTLAIGESWGNLTNATRAGVVNIFNTSQFP